MHDNGRELRANLAVGMTIAKTVTIASALSP